jgi:hypothetical protein
MADAAARLPGPPPGAHTFEDVPPDSTFYEWVEPLASAGLVSGYACGGEGEPCGPGARPYYRPGVSVTRGQAAKLASGLFLRECAGTLVGESSTLFPAPEASQQPGGKGEDGAP